MQIRHHPSGAIIAAGPLGFGITPFEGHYYIRRRYLREGRFRADYLPGLCVYKGLYIGLDYVAPDRSVTRHLGWLYWLPNPLLPFIPFRVAVPTRDPALIVEFADVHENPFAGAPTARQSGSGRSSVHGSIRDTA